MRTQVKAMNLLRNLFEGRSEAVRDALAWWNAAGGPSVPAVVAQTLHRCGDTPGGSRLAEQALHVASNVAASTRVTCRRRILLFCTPLLVVLMCCLMSFCSLAFVKLSYLQ